MGDDRLYTPAVQSEWDPPKAKANLKEHEVGFAEAVTVLDDDYALTREDPDESVGRRVHVPRAGRPSRDLGLEGQQTPEGAL